MLLDLSGIIGQGAEDHCGMADEHALCRSSDGQTPRGAPKPWQGDAVATPRAGWHAQHMAAEQAASPQLPRSKSGQADAAKEVARAAPEVSSCEACALIAACCSHSVLLESA